MHSPPPSNGFPNNGFVVPPLGNGVKLTEAQRHLDDLVSAKGTSTVDAKASSVQSMKMQPCVMGLAQLQSPARFQFGTDLASFERMSPRLSAHGGDSHSYGAGSNDLLRSDVLNSLQAAVRIENHVMCETLSKQIALLGAELRSAIRKAADSNNGIVVASESNEVYPSFGNRGSSRLSGEEYDLFRHQLSSLVHADKDEGALVVDAHETDKSGVSHKRSTEVKQTYLYDFTNVEDIKLKVREMKLGGGRNYNVQDYYKSTGIFQFIARHPYFEFLTLAVIVLNAVYIGFDTDGNDAATLLDAKTVFIVGDCTFCSYYVIELFIRLMAFQLKRNALLDAWFVFDSSICLLYVFDPFVITIVAAFSDHGDVDLPTSVLRLLRLARLIRLTRMLRSLPELMIMIKSMLSALATVGYTLGHLLMITYVFAIAMRFCVPSGNGTVIEELYFSSVLEALHNLIIYGTFLDDLADFMHNIQRDSGPCLFLAWVYVAIASLVVLNMLIGILCEVIQQVATGEREGATIESIKEKFGSVMRSIDKDHDGLITWDEFQTVMIKPESVRHLKGVNVDPEILVEAAEDFFFDENETESPMSFEQFICLVLDVRSGQQATVKDVLGQGKRITQKFLSLKSRIDTLENKLDRLLSYQQTSRSPSVKGKQ